MTDKAPEEAVIEAAEEWAVDAERILDSITGELTDTAAALIKAVRDLHASRKPKDYAPDDLDVGVRFRFSDDSSKGVAVLMWRFPGRVLGYRWNRLNSFLEFKPGDRIIPISEDED